MESTCLLHCFLRWPRHSMRVCVCKCLYVLLEGDFWRGRHPPRLIPRKKTLLQRFLPFNVVNFLPPLPESLGMKPFLIKGHFFLQCCSVVLGTTHKIRAHLLLEEKLNSAQRQRSCHTKMEVERYDIRIQT